MASNAYHTILATCNENEQATSIPPYTTGQRRVRSMLRIKEEDYILQYNNIHTTKYEVCGDSSSATKIEDTSTKES